MSVDTLDMMIIEQLKADARQPVLALARKLGLNRETVRYRLNRLIGEGILAIICVSDMALLGYQYLLVIGVRARPGRAETVASQLATLTAVKHVCTAAGRYNIIAWAVIADRSALLRLVSADLTQVSDDIASIEIMHSYHFIKEWWGTFSRTMKSTPDYPGDLSDLDMSIVQAIQLDPRQTIKQLSKTVGCSRTVAKTRLERLMDSGIIRLNSLVNPTLPGEGNGVVILVKSELNKVYAVANELAAPDSTMHVSLITGQWQLIVVARFQDAQNMYNFTLDAFSSVPGVIEAEVVTLGKTVKFSPNFLD